MSAHVVLDLLVNELGKKIACECNILFIICGASICVFEHSVMTNFNCACPAIQRDQGSGFLSDGSS